MERNQVLTTDTEFKDSPDTGRPECICSRCGKKITAREFAMRVFTGKKRNTEFRYCPSCQAKDWGITSLSQNDDDEDDDYFPDTDW